jgi:hypothetical protein
MNPPKKRKIKKLQLGDADGLSRYKNKDTAVNKKNNFLKCFLDTKFDSESRTRLAKSQCGDHGNSDKHTVT